MKNFKQAKEQSEVLGTSDLDEFMIQVSDDWYGNYEGNRVYVALYYLDEEFRLVVSGNDDFMIELDGDSKENESKIGEIFDHLKNNPEQVYNQQWFLDKGMFVD